MPCTANTSGRVLLVHWAKPIGIDDWIRLRARIARECEQRSSLIICSDCRALSDTISRTPEGELLAMFQEDNPTLLRSAILVDANDFMLQLSSAVRRAGNPRRRVFFTKEYLLDWLVPVLTPIERQAVVSMLEGTLPLDPLESPADGNAQLNA